MNLDKILPSEERDRAERFVFARDATRFRRCRSMLRMGLAWYLNKAPHEIELTTGWYGKPCLVEACGMHFNVTHCGGLALIAFTTTGEVGIDVEAIERDVEALDIANSHFTMKEAAMIQAAETREDRVAVFLRLWTRKEAVLKAAGWGLLEGLNTVDVSQQSENLVTLSGTSGESAKSSWLVRDMEGINGFAAAIAADPGDWSIRQWPIRCEEAYRHLLARFPGGL